MQRSSCRVRCGIRRRLWGRRRTYSPSRDGWVRSRLGGGLAYCRLSIATALVGTCSGSYRWIFAILVTREAGSLAGLPLLVSCSKPWSTCPSRSDRRASATPSRRASIPSRRALFLPSRRPVCLEKEEVDCLVERFCSKSELVLDLPHLSAELDTTYPGFLSNLSHCSCDLVFILFDQPLGQAPDSPLVAGQEKEQGYAILDAIDDSPG